LEFLVSDDSPWPIEGILRGHHDPVAFRAAVQAALDRDYDEGSFRPVGAVTYGWARKIPSTEIGRSWIFWPVGTRVRDARGVFAYTGVAIAEVEVDDE